MNTCRLAGYYRQRTACEFASSASEIGTPLAAILAARGHDVTGVDARPGVVELLNQGRPPFKEPGLAELIERSRSRLRATTDLADAAADAEASFIVVLTPSTANGTFSVRFVVDAIEGIDAGFVDRRITTS